MIGSILLTILLVALNGFFVAAEFALVKVRASQIELRAQAGNRFARLTQHMLANLDAYLSATQLGITLASLGLGWIGEEVVSEIVLAAMHALGVAADPVLAHKISFPVAFAVITVLHITFGELAPKSLAIQRPEATSLALAAPMQAFYWLFRPFIYVLNGLSGLILRLCGLRAVPHLETHSADELRLILEQSKTSGELHTDEHELIENVFEFNDRMVKQIMVPRTKIAAIAVTLTEDEALAKLLDEGFSRVPVYEEVIDNIVGILYVKDLLAKARRQEEPVQISQIIRPAYFVPETIKIHTLLKQFQSRHLHMAIVTDEFGGVSGLVTMEDVVEELVGEIQDEYDNEATQVEQTGPWEYRVDTALAIPDANEALPFPLPEAESYETVGGYLHLLYEGIPEVNDLAQNDDYEFRVLQRSQRNVELVQLTVREDKRSEEE
jgi:CBS domain containing-hemolysin-like protein